MDSPCPYENILKAKVGVLTFFQMRAQAATSQVPSQLAPHLSRGSWYTSTAKALRYAGYGLSKSPRHHRRGSSPGQGVCWGGDLPLGHLLTPQESYRRLARREGFASAM